jgi:abortive infection bacteriophage resistance protein
VKNSYTKPALSYEQQIELLKSRGMTIENEELAKFYLKNINYYRLRAYWLSFEEDTKEHNLKTNTSFEDVLNLYVFDRELRLLLLDAIERIEVSVRTAWTYEFSMNYGSHAHLDSSLFENHKYYLDHVSSLIKEVNRSQELFIEHFNKNYKELLPPIWAVSEVMSIGLLSKWISNLYESDRKVIARRYKLGKNVLASWLKHLTIVRNLSAHHCRLWGKNFKTTPTLISDKNHPLCNQFIPSSRKLYNTFVIILYFMDLIAPNHSWRRRLKEHLLKNPQYLKEMDFPSNWQEQIIWKEKN